MKGVVNSSRLKTKCKFCELCGVCHIPNDYSLIWKGKVTRTTLKFAPLPEIIKYILMESMWGKEVKVRVGHASGIYYQDEYHGFYTVFEKGLKHEMIFSWDLAGYHLSYIDFEREEA